VADARSGMVIRRRPVPGPGLGLVPSSLAAGHKERVRGGRAAALACSAVSAPWCALEVGTTPGVSVPCAPGWVSLSSLSGCSRSARRRANSAGEGAQWLRRTPSHVALVRAGSAWFWAISGPPAPTGPTTAGATSRLARPSDAGTVSPTRPPAPFGTGDGARCWSRQERARRRSWCRERTRRSRPPSRSSGAPASPASRAPVLSPWVSMSPSPPGRSPRTWSVNREQATGLPRADRSTTLPVLSQSDFHADREW